MKSIIKYTKLTNNNISDFLFNKNKIILNYFCNTKIIKLKNRYNITDGVYILYVNNNEIDWISRFIKISNIKNIELINGKEIKKNTDFLKLEKLNECLFINSHDKIDIPISFTNNYINEIQNFFNKLLYVSVDLIISESTLKGNNIQYKTNLYEFVNKILTTGKYTKGSLTKKFYKNDKTLNKKIEYIEKFLEETIIYNKLDLLKNIFNEKEKKKENFLKLMEIKIYEILSNKIKKIKQKFKEFFLKKLIKKKKNEKIGMNGNKIIKLNAFNYEKEEFMKNIKKTSLLNISFKIFIKVYFNITNEKIFENNNIVKIKKFNNININEYYNEYLNKKIQIKKKKNECNFLKGKNVCEKKNLEKIIENIKKKEIFIKKEKNIIKEERKKIETGDNNNNNNNNIKKKYIFIILPKIKDMNNDENTDIFNLIHISITDLSIFSYESIMLNYLEYSININKSERNISVIHKQNLLFNGGIEEYIDKEKGYIFFINFESISNLNNKIK